MLTMLLAIITILLYCLAARAQSLGLKGKLQQSKQILYLKGVPAVLLHAWLLHHWIDVDGGQNLALFNMFSLTAWAVCLLVLLAALRKPVENLTVFIFPVAAVSILLVLFFPASAVVDTATNPQQLFHILLGVLTFSVLCIAGLQAVLLAIQEKQLHGHHSLSIFQKMPPLEIMERLLFQLISLGFFLLTLMIITSWYFFHDMVTEPLVQKTILVIVAWIIFGVLLIGRHFFGWRGKRAIYGTLAGLALLIVTYYGSILLLDWLL